jgi:hypothetical protein
MTVAATERIPQPMVATGLVSNNLSDRTLSVRLSDFETSGYTRLAWRTAWQELRKAEQLGWSNHPTVWASAPGA